MAMSTGIEIVVTSSDDDDDDSEDELFATNATSDGDEEDTMSPLETKLTEAAVLRSRRGGRMSMVEPGVSGGGEGEGEGGSRRGSLSHVLGKLWNVKGRSNSVTDMMIKGVVSTANFMRGSTGGRKKNKVQVKLPNGQIKEVIADPTDTLRSLLFDLAMEHRLASYKVYLASSSALLDLNAHSSQVEGQLLLLEDVDPKLVTQFEDDLRLTATWHLLLSELNYHKCLLDVFHTYAEPLRKFSSLSPADHRLLFHQLEPLLSLSTSLCRKLETFIQTWDPGTTVVGQLFTKQFWDQHDEYYTNYCDVTRQCLREKKESDEEFVQLCQLRRGAALYSLEKLLLKPVQRIAEYDRHLNELVGHTDPEHPDYIVLSRAAARVSAMVKEREDDLSHMENEIHIDSVQGRFPNDDLQLQHVNDKKAKATSGRRRSAPTAVILRSLSKKQLPSSSTLAKEVVPDSASASAGTAQPPNRVYILEAPVQITVGLQTQERYLFLFNDLLLIAKHKSNTTFKLKQRVRVCEMWIASCLDVVSEASKTADKSFVIGWPTTNVVVTFNSGEVKELWLEKLKEQIEVEKSKENPRAIILKILNVDMGTYSACKCVTVGNNEQARDLVKRCLSEFHIQDVEPKDYQLWVKSNKEDAHYPLIGHEHPYSIKMSHVRDGMEEGSEHSIAPMDVDFNTNDSDVQFKLRQTEKIVRKNSFEDNTKRPKKTKRSPIIKFFRRNQQKPEEVEPLGKLFGHPLSDLCDGDNLPKFLMDLLHHLYINAPFHAGVFRKPGNFKRCQEVRARLDAGETISWDDELILIACSILKEYLRTLPDCLLLCDFYDQWIELLSITDLCERKENTIARLRQLPSCHQVLLRYIMCLLHHIRRREDENKMNMQAITVCISPSLLWSHPTAVTGNALADTVRQTEESEKVRRLLQFMLEYVEDIFGEDCIKVFGDEPPSPMNKASKGTRQDSSTDSDSMHSLLSAPEAGGYGRHDNSSIDSLERDYFTEQEHSPRLAKAHLSPTNLSWDSGLTSSDPRLYDDVHDDNTLSVPRKHSMVRSVSQGDQNSGHRVDAPSEQLSKSFDSTNVSSHKSRVDSLPVPPPRLKKGRRSSPGGEDSQNSSQDLPEVAPTPAHRPQSIGMLKHSSSAITVEDYRKQMRHNHCSNRKSDDSLMGYLGSVEEYEDTSPEGMESLSSLQHLHSLKSGDIGVLKKSASGTKLYVRDDSVKMRKNSASLSHPTADKGNQRCSAPPHVQEVQQILQQAKANIYHDHQPIRQVPPPHLPTAHFFTPGANPSPASHSPSANTTSALPISYSEQHLPTVSQNYAIDHDPVSVTFTSSSLDSADESEDSMLSDFTYVVPVTRTNGGKQAVADMPLTSCSDAAKTPSARRLPLVKSASLDVAGPSPLNQSPSCQQTPGRTPVVATYTPSKAEDRIGDQAVESPVTSQRRLLTRTHAIDEPSPGENIFRKKCMTARGSDIFPTRLVKNLHRQSMDESVILKSPVTDGVRSTSQTVSHESRALPPSSRTSPASPILSHTVSPRIQSDPEGCVQRNHLERSASDTSLLEHMDETEQWQRPKHPPSYQEAMLRRAHINDTSQHEIEIQRQKNLKALQLYEESLKLHDQKQTVAVDKKSERKKYTRSASLPRQTSVSKELSMNQPSQSKSPKHPPSYEQACIRAEQIRESKNIEPKPCNRSYDHHNITNNNSTSLTGNTNTSIVISPPKTEAETGLDKTISNSSESSREGSMTRKQRRKSHERRIAHRNSDSKLNNTVEAMLWNNAKLGRSKSDSSELIQKTSKYRDLSMCGENKENLSNEDLKALMNLEKLPHPNNPRVRARSSTPEKRPTSNEKLAKITKDLENEKTRSQRNASSFVKVPPQQQHLMKQSHKPAPSLDTEHSEERTPSCSGARSVRDRNWHKELAQQYSEPMPEPISATKYAYSRKSSVESARDEAPRRKWMQPIHPSKDLVIINATTKDSTSKLATQVKHAKSNVDVLGGRSMQCDRVQEFEQRGGNNSDAPAPQSNASKHECGSSEKHEEKEKVVRSDEPSEEALDISWSVAQLRNIYTSSSTRQPHTDTTAATGPRETRVTPSNRAGVYHSTGTLERINPHADEEYV